MSDIEQKLSKAIRDQLGAVEDAYIERIVKACLYVLVTEKMVNDSDSGRALHLHGQLIGFKRFTEMRGRFQELINTTRMTEDEWEQIRWTYDLRPLSTDDIDAINICFR